MAGEGAPKTAQGGFAWSPRDLMWLKGNYIDELTAEWVYDELAKIDKNQQRAVFMRQLAEYERKHAEAWKKVMQHLNQPIPTESHLRDMRILVRLAKWFGPGAVLPLLHKGEVEGIVKYRRQQEIWLDPVAQATLKDVLPDEVSHEIDLFTALKKESTSGGVLRSLILGANDGFGSILALVAGVAGAVTDSHTVLIAGMAGLVAGAVSMAASNYVSIQAEREVHATRVKLESQAIEVAPESKIAQLKEAYRQKGLTEAEAETISRRLAERPEELLKAVVAEQHGVAELDFEEPSKLAMYTGLAFVFAGIVPVIPFLFLPPVLGVVASVTLTCTALFFAGVIRALSTLKPFLRSGAEMVLIGLGASVVTYLIGVVVGVAV